LQSLRASTFKDFEVVINADPRSSDDGEALRRSFGELAITYLHTNSSRAVGRSLAAEATQAPIVLHVDTDMTISAELLGECVKQLSQQYDALVVHEVSIGDNFWGRVRALEKACYEGEDSIEALRCLKAQLYASVGGHDPDLVWSEDKDLDIRVRKSGARIGRTTYPLIHHEGAPTLRGIFIKKLGYLGTAADYAERHPDAFADQTNVASRIRILLRNWRKALRHPLQFVGIFVVGATEVSAMFMFRFLRRYAPNRLSRAT
jgi:arabinofuranan 3-O-arabinosyltransferase